MSFNPDLLKGFAEYSYGDSHFCGMQKIDTSKYVLCSNAGSETAALLVDRNTANTDSIDKKIQQLKKISFIDNVSIYGKYIFISPNLGPLVYDNSIKGYNYDPASKRSVSSKINEEIDKIGIDRKAYSIINTAD